MPVTDALHHSKISSCKQKEEKILQEYCKGGILNIVYHNIRLYKQTEKQKLHFFLFFVKILRRIH